METIKLVCEVSAQLAIKNGQSMAGQVEWPMSGVLPLLTETERQWLADRLFSYDEKRCSFQVRKQPGSSWAPIRPNVPICDESVAETIKDLRAEAAKDEEDREEDREAKILAALAIPPEDYQINSYNHFTDVSGEQYYQPDYSRISADGSDPRIVAHIAKILAIYNERKAAYELAKAADAAARAEIKAREAVEAKQRAEIIREWAESCEALPARIRRAAAEDLDVQPELRKLAIEAVRTMIASVLSGTDGVICDVDTYGREATNRVPSDEAYEVIDALRANAGSIADAAILPGVDVHVDGFFRIDVSRGKAKWRNAVDVIVTCPWFPDHDLGQIVLTEPVDQDEDSEE